MKTRSDALVRHNCFRYTVQRIRNGGNLYNFFRVQKRNRF